MTTQASSSSCRTAAYAELEQALKMHLPDLRARALRLTRDADRADELVQDTVERALRFCHKLQADSHPRAWLMVIMQNVFISQMRRRGVERRVLDSVRFDPNAWASRATTQLLPGLSKPVRSALGTLPERLQEVVCLVDLHDFSYREAAEQQQVPVGTVMSRLHRGRARLGSALNPAQAA